LLRLSLFEWEQLSSSGEARPGEGTILFCANRKRRRGGPLSGLKRSQPRDASECNRKAFSFTATAIRLGGADNLSFAAPRSQKGLFPSEPSRTINPNPVARAVGPLLTSQRWQLRKLSAPKNCALRHTRSGKYNPASLRGDLNARVDSRRRTFSGGQTNRQARFRKETSTSVHAQNKFYGEN